MSTPRLVTIPFSHFCEKARWALDRAGVSYVEQAHVPMVHRPYSKAAGGSGSVPVLVTADGPLGESAEILRWADATLPEPSRLYPGDPSARAEVDALVQDFDRGLGPKVRLWAYFELGRGPEGRGRRADLIVPYAGKGAPAFERVLLRLGWSPVLSLILRAYGCTPERADKARARIDATFDAVGERLAAGGPWICGERFTAADLVFASLAAPLLSPPEHPFPAPDPALLGGAASEQVARWRAHPAGQHALRTYRVERHRRADAPATA
ncbi:MAG: glutathione S-transferase [Deltaproteobacteria bacterium]|nr:glutathione S-transferase [Deltaproteobacteria bacterium]MCB9787939.1 glutathione S-transferase [Deltaproteobacteria bacterium]